MNPSDPDRSGSRQSESNVTGPPESAAIDPKTRIRHKLVQVRREAEAARLEANAARLEASAEHLEEMLERVDAGHALSHDELSDLGLTSDAVVDREAGTPSPEPEPLEPEPLEPKSDPTKDSSNPAIPATAAVPGNPTHRFQSWAEIRDARSSSASMDATSAQTPIEPVVSTEAPGKIVRTDSPHASIIAPKMRRRKAGESPDSKVADPKRTDAELPVQTQTDDGVETAAVPPNGIASAGATEPAEKIEPAETIGAAETTGATIGPATEVASETAAIAPVEREGNDEPETRRRHPMALIVSGLVHAFVFLVLAGLTLTTTIPKDQVALSASVSESSESAFETFQIESVEPMLEPTQTTPAETQFDISPLGEMAAVDVSSEVMAAASQPTAAASALAQPIFNDSAKLESLKSDSKSKMEFCGVEGGGNHFVYLVDSSGSMGDAFTAARRALIESIDMLGEQQRFYVIFFDADCDYMRISRANEDEARSVYATAENKQKLKSWAMRVSMDRGKAPYEPLEFALKTLRPDVIFLLSDGEFPQGIEDLLSETNYVSNLFGDESPISIIHTISYHSREGEARMRRIAEKNYGQYRHVPKPRSR